MITEEDFLIQKSKPGEDPPESPPRQQPRPRKSKSTPELDNTWKGLAHEIFKVINQGRDGPLNLANIKSFLQSCGYEIEKVDELARSLLFTLSAHQDEREVMEEEFIKWLRRQNISPNQIAEEDIEELKAQLDFIRSLTELKKPHVLQRSFSFTKEKPKERKKDEKELDDKECEEKFASVNKKIKIFCRAGLNELFRKVLWPELVDQSIHVNSEKAQKMWAAALKETFFNGEPPETIPREIIPTFGGTLPRQLSKQAEELLCVLAANQPQLTYCPMLVHIVPVLLKALSPPLAYYTIERMIKRSGNQFYLSLTDRHAHEFIKAFTELMKAHAGTVYKHFMKHKMDPAKIFLKWSSRFFVDYLNSYLILRIMDVFLLEGLKILYRVALGILKLYEKEVLRCSTEEEVYQTLKTFILEESGEILRVGFSINLRRKSIEKIWQSFENDKELALSIPKSLIFHVPKFDSKTSEILNTEQCLRLWAHLPAHVRVYDPIVKWKKTSERSNSLSDLLSAVKSEGLLDKPMMLLIKDGNNQVFGMYMQKGFQITKEDKEVADGNSLVFSIVGDQSVLQVYAADEHSERLPYRRCCDEEISLGDIDTAALSISSRLDIGHTNETKAYQNPSLFKSKPQDKKLVPSLSSSRSGSAHNLRPASPASSPIRSNPQIEEPLFEPSKTSFTPLYVEWWSFSMED